MSALDEYKAAQRESAFCVSWAGLLGAPYCGGGGGVGRLVSLKLVAGEGAPTIYHQYSDGAQNYHHCPGALLKHLEAEIKQRFPEILEAALKRQADVCQQLARAALAEHALLMKDAGLTAPTEEQP